jgi:hypothetical protein
MAKQFRVVNTTIKYGKPDGEIVEFAPGDIVTGLSTDQMKELWDAGVLEAVDVVEKKSEPTPKTSPTPTVDKTPAEGSQTPSTGGDEVKA